MYSTNEVLKNVLKEAKVMRKKISSDFISDIQKKSKKILQKNTSLNHDVIDPFWKLILYELKYNQHLDRLWPTKYRYYINAVGSTRVLIRHLKRKSNTSLYGFLHYLNTKEGQKIILGTDGLLFLVPIFKILFHKEAYIFPISRTDLIIKGDVNKEDGIIRKSMVTAIIKGCENSKKNPKKLFEEIESVFIAQISSLNMQRKKSVIKRLYDLAKCFSSIIKEKKVVVADLCNRFGTQAILLAMLKSPKIKEMIGINIQAEIYPIIGINTNNFKNIPVNRLQEYYHVDEATMGFLEHLRDYIPNRVNQKCDVFREYYKLTDHLSRFVCENYRKILYYSIKN